MPATGTGGFAWRRLADALLFGALTTVVLVLPGQRRGLHILVLLAIAALGYRYVSQRLLPHLAALLAFAAGWFGFPLIGLVGLWLVASVRRASRDAPRPEVANRAALARLTLRTALEAPGCIRGFRVPFTSPHGGGEIPLLMTHASGEAGFYIDGGSRETDAQVRFLDWIARLRASERSNLRIELRGARAAPEALQRACGFEPGVLEELSQRLVGRTQ